MISRFVPPQTDFLDAWIETTGEARCRVDVEIEKTSVALLIDATNAGSRLEANQLRAVLTIVKINNEMERIADSAVAIA